MNWQKPCGGIGGANSSKRFFQNNSSAGDFVRSGAEGFLKVQMPNNRSKGTLRCHILRGMKGQISPALYQDRARVCTAIHPSPWGFPHGGSKPHSVLSLLSRSAGRFLPIAPGKPHSSPNYLKICVLVILDQNCPILKEGSWSHPRNNMAQANILFLLSFFNFASSSSFQLYPSCWLELRLALAFPLPPYTHFFILAPFSPVWEQNLVPALCPHNQSSS